MIPMSTIASEILSKCREAIQQAEYEDVFESLAIAGHKLFYVDKRTGKCDKTLIDF